MSTDLIGRSGSSGDSFNYTDTIIYHYDTATYTGTLSKMYVRGDSDWDPGEKVRGAVYVSSTREIVAQTSEIDGAGTSGWNTANFGPSSITAGTTYIIAIWSDENGKYIYWTTGGGKVWYDTGRDYSDNDSGDFASTYQTLDSQTNYSTHSYGHFFYAQYNYFLHSKDMAIYYSSLSLGNFVDCWCNRWDHNNWNVVIETMMDKSDYQTLEANITPGAVGELYEILGSKVYYDMTWNGGNTIKLVPNEDFDTSTLGAMRDEEIIYVKNISSTPLGSDSGLLNVKIEGYISGGSL